MTADRSDHPTAGLALAVAGGLGAAIGYAGTNMGLRYVSGLDPFFVSAMKALPTVILAAPWIAAMVWRGQKLVPDRRLLGWMIVTALIGQLGGNVLFQLGLRHAGLALSVPINLGAMIIGGAVAGRTLLGEPITRKVVVASCFLVAATAILSWAPPPDQTGSAATRAMAVSGAPPTTGNMPLGLAANLISGIAYGALGVGLRYCLRGGLPTPVVIGTSTGIGLLVLGAIGLQQIGFSGLAAINHRQWIAMVIAGTLNAIAFVMLTHALKRLGVTVVNLLNATQATLAAVAGVLMFAEPLTTQLTVGVCLTAFGLGVLSLRR
jgi:drug/metabolite transporter (DMT)-like permease